MNDLPIIAAEDPSINTDNVNFIAFYGTLLGNNSPMLEKSHEDTVFGDLWDMGPWPALRLSDDGRDVPVTIYRILDRNIIQDLDDYEGVPSLYHRSVVMTGEGYTTYVYTFTEEPKEYSSYADMVPVGSWPEYKDKLHSGEL